MYNARDGANIERQRTLTQTKCKVVHTHIMYAYRELEVSLHALLTPAMNEGDWSASRSGRFIPREEAPSTQGTGGHIQGGPKVGTLYTIYCIPNFGPHCMMHLQFSVFPSRSTASVPTSVLAHMSTTPVIVSVVVSRNVRFSLFISSMAPQLLTVLSLRLFVNAVPVCSDSHVPDYVSNAILSQPQSV